MGMRLAFERVGRRAEIETAQTLCGSLNYRKTNSLYSNLEIECFKDFTHKQNQIQAIHAESNKVIEFCDEVIEIYKKYAFQSND